MLIVLGDVPEHNQHDAAIFHVLCGCLYGAYLNSLHVGSQTTDVARIGREDGRWCVPGCLCHHLCVNSIRQTGLAEKSSRTSCYLLAYKGDIDRVKQSVSLGISRSTAYDLGDHTGRNNHENTILESSSQDRSHMAVVS